jgi:hypothetical protein
MSLAAYFHTKTYDIGGADTCVFGKGWKVLSIHNTRRENVLGLDHEAAV